MQEQDKLDLIRRAEEAYDRGEPIMTDAEYDALTADAKVEQAIGGYEIPAALKIKHRTPMLSLQKVRDEDNLFKWLAKLPTGTQISVENKYDGFAVSALYQDGQLQHVVTRGDGVQGENITANARGSLAPETIKTQGAVEIRGEAFMRRDSLRSIETDHGIVYDNTRNAVPGLLRRKDPLPRIVAEHVDLVVYDVIPYDGQQIHQDDLDAIQSTRIEGNVTTDWTPEWVVSRIEQIGTGRASLEYDIDGAVVKVMDEDVRQDLGSNNHHPKWAVAWKYESVSKPTTIRDVEWGRGRTGRVIPVAVFDPVDLGTNVSRATMHNYATFQQMAPRVGDTIFVTRANDVIPYVESVLKIESSTALVAPTQCPECRGDLKVIESGVDLLCDNKDCGIIGRVVYALGVLGVKGVSVALVNKLFEDGQYLDGSNDIIDALHGLLNISEDHIRDLDGYGETSARKAVEALSVMREADLGQWIASIGIKSVGRTNAAKIAHALGSIDEIVKDVLVDHWMDQGNIPGIGYSAISQLEGNLDQLKRLARMMELNNVEQRVDRVEVDEDSEFAGLNVVITGSFEGHTRDDIASWFVSQGATVQGSVNGKTNLLVAGERAGSKKAKAESLGVRIIEGLPFA